MAQPNMKLTYLTLCPGVTKQVWMRNATKDALIRGHVHHFQNGMAGITWSCGFSNVIKDPENRSRFDHPTHLGSHVIQTRAYIIVGELNGTLVVVQYAHNYGTLVDMNDDKLIIQIIKSHPEQLEQEFLFRTPPIIKRSLKPSIKKTNSGLRRSFFPRGATARAVKAGFMSLQEAQERLRKQQDEYEFRRLKSATDNEHK
jgi:hypothetical protein